MMFCWGTSNYCAVCLQTASCFFLSIGKRENRKQLFMEEQQYLRLLLRDEHSHFSIDQFVAVLFQDVASSNSVV
ncbi:hypothetical protein PHET_07778 [Paragonimus heterotremus]|uniref:Uncharacterized protein n=1 Tax=Paragonimus heterotremus TaxID=100268 RepID=A0A8J4SVC5_9TREM|nr:hypothetical protein PHET_07778 [Paragonimus heterotremus]